MKPIITYADFDKLDLRVGTVLEASVVEGSEKLVKLLVNFGDEPEGIGKRTLLSGIQKYFNVEDLIGLQVLVIVNLEPKKMMGLESQGMVLMADVIVDGQESTPILMIPQFKAPNGSRVI